MENAKQKAIEKAYGAEWDKVKDLVDENGWLYWGFRGHAGDKSPCSMAEMETYVGYYSNRESKTTDVNKIFFRPKSISGIETNNNWISINSEEDLPSEHYELYFVNGPNISIHQCVYHEGIKDYWLKNFSHWQTIVKPSKPIY